MKEIWVITYLVHRKNSLVKEFILKNKNEVVFCIISHLYYFCVSNRRSFRYVTVFSTLWGICIWYLSTYITGVTMRYFRKKVMENAIAIPKKLEFCGKMSKLNFVVITLIQKNLENPTSFHSLKNVVCTSNILLILCLFQYESSE